MAWRDDISPYDPLPLILDDMRANGWLVAAHNDCELNGLMMTFWLFTHPGGLWAKGEALDDRQAAHNARAQAREREVAQSALVYAARAFSGFLDE